MIDLTGQRFGRLVVTEQHPEKSNGGNFRWVCVCDCGGGKTVDSYSLRRGVTQSCGCLAIEKTKERKVLEAENSVTGTSEYMTWVSMKQRCLNPQNNNYANYGGRGIQVCEAWRDSYENFLSDMGTKPSPDHSIERKENNGNYNPENCIWATRSTQANNRRSSNFQTLNGVTKTVTEWASEKGVDPVVVRKRLERGKSIEDALREPRKYVKKE